MKLSYRVHGEEFEVEVPVPDSHSEYSHMHALTSALEREIQHRLHGPSARPAGEAASPIPGAGGAVGRPHSGAGTELASASYPRLHGPA